MAMNQSIEHISAINIWWVYKKLVSKWFWFWFFFKTIYNTYIYTCTCSYQIVFLWESWSLGTY
jgi:hypothetical protein